MPGKLLVTACRASLIFAAASVYSANANAAGDAAAGATVFNKCKPCHSVEPNGKKVGPSLYGVVGRTPGTLAGYKYSPAMIAFGAGGAVWDAATLDTYLTAPREMIPDIKMFFPGIPDAQERANVIAYLSSLGSDDAGQ